jgi:hypothetical protein
MDDISPKEAVIKMKRWPKNTIAAWSRHTDGLKSCGTVMAVGDNKHGQCDVSGWTDIVAVAAGNVHMATKRDVGTVPCPNETGEMGLGSWPRPLKG